MATLDATLMPKAPRIDSGLDIDALKDVADAIRRVREQDPKRSMLVGFPELTWIRLVCSYIS